jgi:hypothetical protein
MGIKEESAVKERERHIELLVMRLEKEMEEFNPDFQRDAVQLLSKRLPQRLAEDELEEARDAAAVAVGDEIVSSGLSLQKQIVIFKQLRKAADKIARGLSKKC